MTSAVLPAATADAVALLTALEGRLLAHRALLAQMVMLVPPDQRGALCSWLEDRQQPQDGAEDPGSLIGTEAAGALARADEFRLILERVAGH